MSKNKSKTPTLETNTVTVLVPTMVVVDKAGKVVAYDLPAMAVAQLAYDQFLITRAVEQEFEINISEDQL